ncbi:MAG: S8 family serine peptidase [Anaerolineales bacterium]|nr:S8 family serine peptidase [Anaerolineales bacterium]
MKTRRLSFLLFSLFLGVSAAWLAVLGPATAQPVEDTSSTPTAVPTLSPTDEKIDPALLDQMADAGSETNLRFIVHLSATADLNSLPDRASTTARRAALVQELQDTAVASQAPLRQQLAQWQHDGLVATFRPLWIVNAIAVTGQAALLPQLAADPAVARIVPDEGRPLLPHAPGDSAGYLDQATAAAAAAAGQSWGIDKIKVPYAWHALGVDGTGVTVAIMDSGVDWQHPDLFPNYRGNLGGGVIDHTGNWYNTSVPTITVPFDGLGHGTHVAGTAVGQNGLGVAPGARWIAVNIASADGLIYDSDIHAGFQWLLAPAGDVTRAPDVINGSWGGPGWLTTFVPDLQAVHAAGILTVFAAGNSGPEEHSLLSPAGIPGVLAVGATDETDALAWFSSRGPSFLSTEVKPQVTAPGAHILSALPGGVYGYLNGTSMAAPHVTGAAALLLSANGSLDNSSVTHILTETAVPLPTFPAIPNMATGWGLVDVYAAVARQIPHGTLTGVVRGEGAPLPGAVVTVTTSTGIPLAFTTDGNGRYTADLLADDYALAATPFGFLPVSAASVTVQNGKTTHHDFDLVRLPSGTLSVTVLDALSQDRLAATVTFLQAPLSLTTSETGATAVTLPAGTYDVRVSHTGHRLASVRIAITANHTHHLAVNLSRGPRIMLVDSGGWYYDSHADLYQQSLSNLGYAYDYWPITSPFSFDVPGASDLLAGYDTVIWSSPQDSPGYLYASQVITDYLGTGGNMLVSGQNVGYFDGVGLFTEVWWANRLQARYVGKTAVTQTISGAPGTLFDGLDITLNGGDSANNQVEPDVSTPQKYALTDESFLYEDGTAGGLLAAQCRGYHLAYLGFGLEGVTQAADRDAILARTFSFFQTPPTTSGARWLPPAIDDFTPPGAAMVYPLQLQNLSETMTDTFSLAAQGAPWDVALSDSELTIGPCGTAVVTMTVTVPAGAAKDSAFDWALTAVSHNAPGTQASLPVHHKVPGTILLVDDDRWYDQETIYRAALSNAGYTFDEWNIGWDNNVRGSPSQELLNAYDFVIWFTGYDWFQPLSAVENGRLANYLAQGGRLFFSSQDFLYYHRQTPLARDYFGVLAYQESITPTQVFRANTLLPPDAAGPLPLDYGKFKNNSDGLIATPRTAPFLWHDQGMAAGLTAQGLQTLAGDGERPYRAIFWSIPFEKTPLSQQPAMMNSIVGWLSDLGDSTFTVDRPVGAAGEPRTYTITVHNFAPSLSNQVYLTNTLPAQLSLQPDSLTGGAVYEAASSQIVWSGELAGGAAHTITYQAVPQGPATPGTRLDNLLTLAYPRHGLQFTRTAALWLEAPDLHPSRLDAEVAAHQTTQRVTYTLTLSNAGVTATPEMTAVLRLPDTLVPITDSLRSQTGVAVLADQRITWRGAVATGQATTITLALTRTTDLENPEWISAAAYLYSGLGEPVVRAQVSHLPPYVQYFPLIANRP